MADLQDDIGQEEDGGCWCSSSNNGHGTGWAFEPLLYLIEEGAANE